MEQFLATFLISALSATILTLCSLKMLQIYQLSSYKAEGFYAWLKRTRFDYVKRYFVLAFFQFLSLFIFNYSFHDSWAKYLGLIIYTALGVFFIVLYKKEKQKTPLKITNRIKRQLFILAGLFWGFSIAAIYPLFPYYIGYSLVAVVTLFIPLIVTLSHLFMLPTEISINNRYKRKAAKALDKSNIIKIGITGSFGKTTAKNILAAFLGQKYKVLSSPSSHNTPMGLSKLINNGLGDNEVLIAEMGARYSGDIAELCEMVKPSYGIITVTGEQHLETFGSLSEIVKTKLELAQSADTVVLNSDDKNLLNGVDMIKISHAPSDGIAKVCTDKGGKSDCAAMYQTKNIEDKCFLYSGTDGKDASFSDISVSCFGTKFTLNIGGETTEINTVLLGRHIPPLIAQCALLSTRLGITLDQIKDAAKDLQPVPHRLQLIKTDHSVVIDDAYNANPEGAKNALEVLSLFEGARVVVTPGFVEMGEKQHQQNLLLGERIAASADYLISVGAKDIADGAEKAGMDSSKIFIESSLDNAVKKLQTLNLSQPTILFLNDLPDNY